MTYVTLKLPLAERHKREIRQLMTAVNHYLELALLMGAERESTKHGSNIKGFNKGRQPTNEHLRRLYLGAHLDSAALRLHTVDQVLAKYSQQTSGFKTGEKYFSNNIEPTSRRINLRPKVKRWLHVMLRHNTCHDEDNPAKKSGALVARIDQRRADRRACLRSLEINLVYCTLKKMAASMRRRLAYLKCYI